MIFPFVICLWACNFAAISVVNSTANKRIGHVGGESFSLKFFVIFLGQKAKRKNYLTTLVYPVILRLVPKPASCNKHADLLQLLSNKNVTGTMLKLS